MKKILLLSLAVGIHGCAHKAATPPPAPAPERFVEHTISFQGETLSSIAKWYTGSASNWPAIAAANPGIQPNRLRLGQLVQVPEVLATNHAPMTAEFAARAVKGDGGAPSETVVVEAVTAKAVVEGNGAAAAAAVEAVVVETGAEKGMPAPAGADSQAEIAQEMAQEIEVIGGEAIPNGGAVSLDVQLYQAVLFDDGVMAKDLIAKGANVNYKENGRPLIGWAAHNQTSAALKALIDGGADVNAVDGIGHSPLMRAVSMGSVPNVEALIAAKADLNSRDNDGRSLVGAAIYNANIEITKMLAAAGADASTPSADGESPAMLAAQAEGLEYIQVLGAAKANFNISNAAFTPLVFAISQQRVELVAAILDAGADPNLKTASDQYPLHMAIGQPEVVKALLKAKANPNLVDTFGSSPLARAIRDGDAESVALLIEAGADVNAKAPNGSSLLNAAKFSSHQEIAVLLESHGARDE